MGLVELHFENIASLVVFSSSPTLKLVYIYKITWDHNSLFMWAFL